jgi:hypothetical protein
MADLALIAHPNPATVRKMIARRTCARELGDTAQAEEVDRRLACAIDMALEPLGLTLAEVKGLGL